MDTSAGAIYHQLVVFQNDTSQHELIFNDPSPETQAYIQTLGRGLGLEFEYSSIANSARIIRRPPILAQPAEDDFLNFLDFEKASPPGGELSNAYDIPPYVDLNWNESSSNQVGIGLSQSHHVGTNVSSESFPELDLPSRSIEETLQHVALISDSLQTHLEDSSATGIALDKQVSSNMFLSGLTASQLPVASSPFFQERLPHHLIDAQNTRKDIRRVLFDLGMSEYIDTFLQHGFDTWEAVQDITESDFDALGVKLGYRRKLQREIARSKIASDDWYLRICPEVFEDGSPKPHQDVGRIRQREGFGAEKCITSKSTPLNNISSDRLFTSLLYKQAAENFTASHSGSDVTQAGFHDGSLAASMAEDEVLALNVQWSRSQQELINIAAREHIGRDLELSSRDKDEQLVNLLPGIGTAEKSSRRNNSRASSMGSCTSNNGRNRVTKPSIRRASTQEEAYPGYQVWDSRSANSASSSIGSVASTGRRGPLTGAARAMANAVKAVKACWRCKFLRKPCGVELPCKSCPKQLDLGQNSDWAAVGCKRGELKDQMLEIELCLSNDPYFGLRTNISIADGLEASLHVNQSSQQAIDRRQEALENAIKGVPNSVPFLPEPNWGIEDFLHSLDPFSFGPPISLERLHLHECICAIVWETLNYPKLQPTLGVNNTLLENFDLLRAAADYEAEHENNRIVTLSLICLRTCLEVLRSLPESLDYTSHRACTSGGKCLIKSIETLETYLKMFLTESSRVFFMKDNLRSRTWWLSMFYGLCIQSMVRRGLIKILEYYPWKQHARHSAIKQYLHIALRLFVATSGTYDPLMKSYSANDPLAFWKTKEEKARDQNFKVAQQVVKQENWALLGISGSMQFLRNLFQDSGEISPSRPSSSASL